MLFICQPYDQSMYVPEEITLFQCVFDCVLKCLPTLPLAKKFLEINGIPQDFMPIYWAPEYLSVRQSSSTGMCFTLLN